MSSFKFVADGTITTVPGYRAAGVTAGFKRSGAPDFALVFSERPADFAGVFTTCAFAAAPVHPYGIPIRYRLRRRASSDTDKRLCS